LPWVASREDVAREARSYNTWPRRLRGRCRARRAPATRLSDWEGGVGCRFRSASAGRRRPDEDLATKMTAGGSLFVKGSSGRSSMQGVSREDVAREARSYNTWPRRLRGRCRARRAPATRLSDWEGGVGCRFRSASAGRRRPDEDLATKMTAGGSLFVKGSSGRSSMQGVSREDVAREARSYGGMGASGSGRGLGSGGRLASGR
jgi:hypothetical protein